MLLTRRPARAGMGMCIYRNCVCLLHHVDGLCAQPSERIGRDGLYVDVLIQVTGSGG